MCLNARPVVQDILYGQESSRKQKRDFGTEYGKEPFKQDWRATPQIHIQWWMDINIGICILRDPFCCRRTLRHDGLQLEMVPFL